MTIEKKKRFTRTTKKVRLDLRVPESLKLELEEFCRLTDQSITLAVVQAIKKYIRKE